MHRVNVRRSTALALVGMLAACGSASTPATPAPSPSPTALVPAATVTLVPTGKPVASPSAPQAAGTPTSTAVTLSTDSLPRVALDPMKTTAICDVEPEVVNPDAGTSNVDCAGALALSASVTQALAGAAPSRLYLHRPACVSTPCTDDELNTATATVLVGRQSYAISIDARTTSVTATQAPDTGWWPTPASYTAPAVFRPVLAKAPAEVASRTAYPFCGAKDGNPDIAAWACFQNAVETGGAAELLSAVPDTGSVWVFRYSGAGAVTRYRDDHGSWSSEAGTTIIGGLHWALDPWAGTTKAVR